MFLLTYQQKDFKPLPENLPTIHELIFYLTKRNDNIMVYVKNIYPDLTDNVKVYEMSNGFSYSTKEVGKWYMISSSAK